MRYSGLQVVFQEIPQEISLAFHISGCPLRCKGCHSSDLWDKGLGNELNLEELLMHLNKFRKYITCVLFMGGEWEPENLIILLKQCRAQNFKTALYSGFDIMQIDSEVLVNLDYVKYGPYIESLGGLSSRKTNQRLVQLPSYTKLSMDFMEEEKHDQAKFESDTREDQIYSGL